MALLDQLVDHIKVPRANVDKVSRLECVCSFDTPESKTGLYICLGSFEAIGESFLDYYYERYKHRVYLNHKRLRFKLDKPDTSLEIKPKRLAIGVDNGFKPDAETEYRFEDTYTIFVMPDKTSIPYSSSDVPKLVCESVEAILSADQSDIVPEASNFWDGEQLKETKYANDLNQVDNPPQIPPTGWKCEKCDMKNNLWLNLSDGSILCGRKFYDGSGGNNHAVEHYEKHQHPLAVKLGTITQNGADVYSYPENDLVIDPNLDLHLSHFGINTKVMNKTEKSTFELEIDINEKLGEWSLIQEEGKKLTDAFGPEFTGLINMGNSCYMNSVLQVLFSFEDFKHYYYPPVPVYLDTQGSQDFVYQMAKLAYGLLSGKYSNNDCFVRGIKPKSFKSIVCRDDENFSSRRQQDAQEFLLFLLGKIEINPRYKNITDYTSTDIPPPPVCLFQIGLEERIVCNVSKKVKYSYRTELILPLNVDLSMAINKDELLDYEEKVKLTEDPEAIKNLVKPVPKIPIWSCLKQFSKEEIIEDFYSTATKSKVTATKTAKIKKFPRVLALQMKKFQLGLDWVPKKMDVFFEVPEFIDLETLKATGIQVGEELLEESDSEQAAGEPSLPPAPEPDGEAIATLLSMGIDFDQALAALAKCSNDPMRAIEFIFDPSQEPSGPSIVAGPGADPNTSATQIVYPDVNFENNLYQLKAFISHMGTSTANGHYVCHIKKEDKWYIFNDEKVAVSERPPIAHGYLYFYEKM